MKRALFFACAFLAFSQQQSFASQNSFFSLFDKVCLTNMPNLAKIRNIAAKEKWGTLTQNEHQLHVGENNDESQSWAKGEQGRRSFIVINEFIANDKRRGFECKIVARNPDRAGAVALVSQWVGNAPKEMSQAGGLPPAVKVALWFKKDAPEDKPPLVVSLIETDPGDTSTLSIAYYSNNAGE